MRILFAVVLLFHCTRAAAQQYVISTFAGGAPVPTPAAAVQSSFPNAAGLVLDAAGNLYVAADNCIFKISTAGIMTRIAGTGRPGFSGDGGPATSAQLFAPQGITLDATGKLFIADSRNHRIRKLTLDGNITTFAGTGTAGFSGDNSPATSAQLNLPWSVVFDPSGNLYIADSSNNRVRKVAKTGVITTVAGANTAGYSGNGGPAISAQLNQPKGVAFSPDGGLYISDTMNYEVRKVDILGNINPVAGTGGRGGVSITQGALAANTGIGNPEALAFDKSGNLYIADTGDGLIWKVSSGLLYWVFNGTSNALASMVDANGLAVDSTGALYYTMDSFGVFYPNGSVVRAAPDGTQTSIVGGLGANPYTGDGGPATQARVMGPTSLALDSAGDLFITDPGNNVVREVATTGIITTVAGYYWFPPGSTPATKLDFTQLSQVVLDSAGNLFIADLGEIWEVVARTGTTMPFYKFDPYNTVDRAWGMTFDTFGNLFVSAYANIVEFTPDFKYSNVAGIGYPGFAGEGVFATATPVNQPAQIVTIPYNTFYFADSGNHRIRKVVGGLISDVAGSCVLDLFYKCTSYQGFAGDGGPATSALLTTPRGLAIDSAGNIYIADSGNNRIRKVTPDGTIKTIAGNGTAAYSGDGGLATAASLNNPGAIQVDKLGNIYFADTDNNAVRVLTVLTPVSVPAATLPPGVTGVSYTATLAAQGGALPYTWSIANGALPAGLTLSSSGVISGAPTTAGDATFTVSVTDGAKATASQTMRIHVAAPLVINAVIPSPATVGVPYSLTFTASGGTSPFAWSISSGTLPAGLALSVAGTLTGAPTVTGSSTFTLQATDSGSQSATQQVTLNVLNPAPVISTPSVLPTAVTAISYSQTLAATGGNPVLSWSIVSGTLPAGLQLSPAGIFSGTPTAPGVFTFTASVTDSAGLTVSQALRITVIDATVLSRTAFLPQLLLGAGWTTTLTITNSSTNSVAVLFVLHADDGTALSPPMSVGTGNDPVVATSPAASVPSNGTFTLQLGDPTATASSAWVDVLTSGPVSASVVYQLSGTAPSQSISLETNFGQTASTSYDPSIAGSTWVALANLSSTPAEIIATVSDPSGAEYEVETISLPALGHLYFSLGQRYASTNNHPGNVTFFDASGGVIAEQTLQFAPDGTMIPQQ